jgi:predicted metal-binding protein
MPKTTPLTRRPIADARPATRVTLFVCAECPRGKERRRDFKAQLRSAGRKHEVRVVACRCLDLCPKRGTATIVARRDGPARCAIVDAGAGEAQALALLLDERVGDAVPD